MQSGRQRHALARDLLAAHRRRVGRTDDQRRRRGGRRRKGEGQRGGEQARCAARPPLPSTQEFRRVRPPARRYAELRGREGCHWRTRPRFREVREMSMMSRVARFASSPQGRQPVRHRPSATPRARRGGRRSTRRAAASRSGASRSRAEGADAARGLIHRDAHRRPADRPAPRGGGRRDRPLDCPACTTSPPGTRSLAGPPPCRRPPRAGCRYAADGYARASGRLGVALTTTGPGRRQRIVAAGEAWASRSPLLVIATDIPLTARGRGSTAASFTRRPTRRRSSRPVTKADVPVDAAPTELRRVRLAAARPRASPTAPSTSSSRPTCSAPRSPPAVSPGPDAAARRRPDAGRGARR